MSFQHNAFQHNAFQAGTDGAAVADVVTRVGTVQQGKTRPQVIATVAVNLLVSTLAAVVVAPPVIPTAHAASAPQHRWQVVDTSRSTPKTLLADAQLPVRNSTWTAPDRVRPVTDTSRGTPKPLTADAQLPVRNTPHTASDSQRAVVDTSRGQPVTLQAVVEPLPPRNAEQLGPMPVPRTLPDTSAGTPKPLYADVVQPMLRAPTYQQSKAQPEVVALQYPNLVVNVAPPVVAPFTPYPTVQQVQAWPRMPVISCPPSLKAGPLGNGYSIRLEWDDITGEDGYRVKWGWSSGNYAVTRDLSADVTSLDIDGLPLYQNVYWVVCSMLGGVEQSCTTEIGLTVGRGHTPTTGHIELSGNVPTVTQAPAPAAPLRPAQHIAPVWYPGLPDDTSCGTPKTLYEDVVVPPVAPVADQQAPAGAKKRGRPPKRFVVEWNGRIFHVEGERQALELLAELRGRASERVAKQAQVLARRAVKQDSPPPLDAPTVAVSGDATLGAQRAAERAQAELAALYEREAERAYIAALEWHLDRLRDEHEALTLLVLDDD